MNYTNHSRNIIRGRLRQWMADENAIGAFERYVLYGIPPGRCFTGMLANDFMVAVSSAHVSLNATILKGFAGFLANELPKTMWGTHERVDAWMRLSTIERREMLEKFGLVLTEEEEVLKQIKFGEVELVS